MSVLVKFNGFNFTLVKEFYSILLQNIFHCENLLFDYSVHALRREQ